MSKDGEKEDLRLADRDFSPRWHAIALGTIAAVLLASYFLGVKLFLN